MQNSMTILIMAGGSGERFWPLSTRERPKQLLRLADPEKSLIQMTVERVAPLVPFERIFIATNAIQAPAVKEELPEIPAQNIIIEPAFKDTAAAIGFASLIIDNMFPNSIIAVLASDHLIKKEEEFRKVLQFSAFKAEQEEAIVTLGIQPTYPETGYGYLEVTNSIPNHNSTSDSYEAVKVVRFCEKPALALANQYVNGRRHLWNSGMFIFKTSIMMEAIKTYLPNHFFTLQKIAELKDQVRNPDNATLKELFNSFDKISIDFGVMEKYHKTLVVPVNLGWNDIGSYPALADIFPGNKNNSVIIGTEAKEVDSLNNIVISSTGKKISMLGIQDLIVVETPDNILICTKSQAQNIKKLVE